MLIQFKPHIPQSEKILSLDPWRMQHLSVPACSHREVASLPASCLRFTATLNPIELSQRLYIQRERERERERERHRKKNWIHITCSWTIVWKWDSEIYMRPSSNHFAFDSSYCVRVSIRIKATCTTYILSCVKDVWRHVFPCMWEIQTLRCATTRAFVSNLWRLK